MKRGNYSEAEHNKRLNDLLHRNNIRQLSVDKCEISRSEMTFARHRYTDSGLKPDPEKVRALQEMDSPENVNDLHTFMRFVQYLGKCIPNLSEVYSPLR